MGGVEGTGEAPRGRGRPQGSSSFLIYVFPFLFLSKIFAKSNTPLVFTLWWLQVEGCIPAGLRVCSSTSAEPTGLCCSAVVRLLALSACTGQA